MNQIQCAEGVTLVQLYEMMESKFLSIAKREMGRRGRALMEAQDIIHDAFARGFIERWCKSYRPDACPVKPAPFVFDCSNVPMHFTAQQVESARDVAEAKHHASQELTGLKFWLSFKFRLFVGDEMRRKVQRPALNLDYNRGKEGTATKVKAVQLDDTLDLAVERQRDQSEDLLEVCDEVERTVMEGFYLEGKTLSALASELGCHSNTVHAIKKAALQKIRKTFGIVSYQGR